MRLREKILGSIGEFVIRHNKLVLFVGLVLAAASVYFASGIQSNTRINDMLSKGNPRVAAYDDLTADFGGASMIVTLEGGTKERMAAAAEELAARMRAKPELNRYIRSISLKLEKDFVLDRGFLLQKTADIRRMRKLFDKTSILPFVAALNENLESVYTGDDAAEDLETGRQELDAVSSMAQIGGFAQALRAAVEAPEAADPRADADWAEARASGLVDAIVLGEQYSYSQDGSMLLFAVMMNFDIASNLTACTGILADMKALAVSLGSAYPEIAVGFSGDIAMQADENAAMSSDTLLPSIIAYAVILVLFVFSFKQVRSIVFAMGCLVLGILYNFGFIGAAFGELNLVTSMIASLLVGMGIDYGIQVTTSLNSFREEGHGLKESIRLTFRKSGYGVLLAAATTSASFFVLVACGSRAMRQLGVVAGVGILTCLAAMIFALPALMARFGKRTESKNRIPQIDYGLLERFGALAARRRAPVLIVSALAAVALGASALRLDIEYDMMELEPQNGPAMRTYRKILDKFEMNPNSAIVVTNGVEEARELTRKLEELSSVSEVQSVSNYLPSPDEQRERLSELARIRADLPRASSMSYGPAEVEALAGEVQKLEWNLIELGDVSVAGLGENNKIVRKRDAMIREILGAETGKEGEEVFRKLIAALKADPARAAARLTAMDAPFSAKAAGAVARMAAADRPMTAADLPRSLADNFLDKATGARNIITIYPKASATATNAGLRRYDAALREIAPSITGSTPLFLDFFDEMLGESKKAALYVGILVLLFAFLSFRSVKYTLISAVPPVLSLVLLFGTLPLIGWKINALNLVTLPLNIGIGVAYGTYLLQRYLVEGRDLRAALKYTAKAIFLSAFTTMVGFGSLGLAGSFKMLASFGTVLFIGIGYCYLTTMLVIPALLGGRKAAAAEAGDSDLEERSAS
jgi:uncharacterized protein